MVTARKGMKKPGSRIPGNEEVLSTPRFYMTSNTTGAAFSALPWALMDTAPSQSYCTVYIWLYRHASASAETCFPSIQMLAEKARVGRKTVRDAIAWLMEHGWVEAIKRPGGTTTYWVRIERSDVSSQEA
jgi:hypothetical protein